MPSSTTLFTTLATVAGLATQAAAHMSIWHPSMYGVGAGYSYTAGDPVTPLGPDWTHQDDWWFRGPDWRALSPAARGDNAVMDLPAGGSVTFEIACHMAWTSYGYATTVPGSQLDACPGDNAGPFHSGDPNSMEIDYSLLSGCALGIADVDDINDVTMDNLAIFSVNTECVKQKETSFDIPAKMPACTGEKCICAWFWLANNGTANFYMTGFDCSVSGSPADATPIAPPQDPLFCQYNSSACVSGSKRPLYAYNSPSNVPWFDNNHRPGYHASWSFHDGPQDDIFLPAGYNTSLAATTSATTTSSAASAIPTGSNGAQDVALKPKKATASSSTSGQGPYSAVDGQIGGYTEDGTGIATNEWSSYAGGAGSWLFLEYASPITFNQILLYDRPNLDDQILSGNLTFSDGSSVLFGALPNDGKTPLYLNFSSSVTTSSIRLTVLSVSGTTYNVGLSELEAYLVSSAGFSSTVSVSGGAPQSTTTVAPVSTEASSTLASTSASQTPSAFSSSVEASSSALPSPTSEESSSVAAPSSVQASSSAQASSSVVQPSSSIQASSSALPTSSALPSSTAASSSAASSTAQSSSVLSSAPSSSASLAASSSAAATSNVLLQSQSSTLASSSVLSSSSALPSSTQSSSTLLSSSAVPTTSSSSPSSSTLLASSTQSSSRSTVILSSSASPSPLSILQSSSSSSSQASRTTTSSASPSTTATNLALKATAKASSQFSVSPASAAIDGVVGGYANAQAMTGGNPANEWSSYYGRAGQWIQLTWSSAVTFNQVVLFDRLNPTDQVIGGNITFADNTGVSFGALNNDGSAVYVNLSSSVTTTSLKVYISSVSASTENVGLAEIQVFLADSSKFLTKVTPTAAPVPVRVATSSAARTTTTTSAARTTTTTSAKATSSSTTIKWYLAPVTTAAPKTTTTTSSKPTSTKKGAIAVTAGAAPSTTLTTTSAVRWYLSPQATRAILAIPPVVKNPKAGRKRHVRDFRAELTEEELFEGYADEQ